MDRIRLTCAALLLSLVAVQALVAAVADGQIVRDAAHPQYLKRQAGGTVWLCGPGDPEGFLYLGTRNADGTRSGPQVTLIDKLSANGGNCIYFHVVRSHGGDGDATQNPWIGSNPANGLSKPILDQWEGWFTRMDDAGICIYMHLYDDSASPFGGGDTVGTAERAFVQALVNRFKHHRNLIWLVGEECEEAYTKARVVALAQVIADADDADHIIGTHHLSRTDFTYYASPMTLFSMQRNVATSSVHGEALAARGKAEAAGGGNGYMAIYSENTVERGNDTTSIRTYIWEIAMAGVMPMRLGMDISNTPVEALQACRTQQRFFESTDVATMSSQDALRHLGTAYVLANPGQSVIAYSSSLVGQMGVKGLTSGTYAATWVDCVSGTTVTQSGLAVAGGDTGFTRPSGIGTWCAVWLRRTGGGTTTGSIRFTTSGATVSEGAGSVTLTAERINGSDGAASVKCATMSGSATSGADFSAVSQTLSWTAGQSGARSITIPILEDALIEGGESFTVVLSGATGATLGSPSTATVTIADNEAAANVAPVANNQSLTTVSGTAISISLSISDADGPGPYTYSIVTQPTHGTLSGVAGNNDWIYTPTAGYAGPDSFTWRVNDGRVNSNIATCSLTVQGSGGSGGSGGLVISGLSAASGKAYVLDTSLAAGDLLYIDRTLTFSSVGTRTGLPHIRTANDDKQRTDVAFLRFTVDRPVTVLLLYDDRANGLPSGFTGWTNTGEVLSTTDSARRVWAKNFPAGAVALPGNWAGGSTGALSMYGVALTVQSSGGPVVTGLSAASGKAYVLDTALAAGDLPYIDRTFTFSSVGTLTGLPHIRTANDDKQRTDVAFLRFTVDRPVTVLLLYDGRATRLPSGFTGWTDTGEVLSTTDSARRVWEKDFPAGAVTLPANWAGGSTGALSMYGVALMATPSGSG
jgi:hypothetical protein